MSQTRIASENQDKDFFTTLIHELNQQLTVIKAYMDGCELRLQKKELDLSQLALVFQKVNKHIDILSNSISSLQEYIQTKE